MGRLLGAERVRLQGKADFTSRCMVPQRGPKEPVLTRLRGHLSSYRTATHPPDTQDLFLRPFCDSGYLSQQAAHSLSVIPHAPCANGDMLTPGLQVASGNQHHAEGVTMNDNTEGTVPPNKRNAHKHEIQTPCLDMLSPVLIGV